MLVPGRDMGPGSQRLPARTPTALAHRKPVTQVDAAREVAAVPPRTRTKQGIEIFLSRRALINVRHRLVLESGEAGCVPQRRGGAEGCKHLTASQPPMMQHAAIGDTRVRYHHLLLDWMSCGGNDTQPVAGILDDDRLVDEPVRVIRQEAPRM